MQPLAPRNAAGPTNPGDIPANTFYRYGAHGFLELVDKATNAVLSIQETVSPLPRAEFIEAEIEGTKFLVQSGIDASALNLQKRYPFSQTLADLIVQKVIEGTYLSDIPKIKGFPDAYTIARWRSSSAEFDTDIRFAKKMRAERLRDEALKAAEESVGKQAEYVSGYKLKVDTLKWAAEKDCPEEFGNKVEVKGQIGLVTLVVETGIRRRGDPGVTITEPPAVIEEAPIIKETVGE